MVFRVVVEASTAVVEGLLDGEALESVLATCRACRAERLVLRVGTAIRGECMAVLAELDMDVVAESPYLARWLERAHAERSKR